MLEQRVHSSTLRLERGCAVASGRQTAVAETLIADLMACQVGGHMFGLIWKVSACDW